MAKVIVLPLLKMSSGHHQVADTVLIDLIKNGHTVKKIDLLSDSWKLMESSLTSVYNHTLNMFPRIYKSIYKRVAGPENYNNINFTNGLGAIFDNSMLRIINREKPDFIICTHGFPSSILDRLKKNKKCSIPVANIYTDFFINNFWGTNNIEYHFVPSVELKENLLKRNGNLNVIVSGIPVSRVYKNFLATKKSDENIIITGGSSGLGSIKSLIDKINTKGVYTYYVLCGNNNRLYKTIINMGINNVIPLTYISSKEEMCKLYDKASLIIGKPGGVTISECLHRRKLYYVHQCLPGQELYNLKYLENSGLIINGCNDKCNESLFQKIINDNNIVNKMMSNIENYLSSLGIQPGGFINKILSLELKEQAAGGID